MSASISSLAMPTNAALMAPPGLGGNPVTSVLGASPSSVTSLGAKPFDMDKANKSAEQFEAVFLGQMLQPMFEGIKNDKLFGGGHGEEMFRSMLVSEYGNKLAASGGIGIADAVKGELLKMQAKNSAPSGAEDQAGDPAP